MSIARIQVGYTLSSEEFSPLRLVELAESAEAAGFDFVGISDHFHPWIKDQGESSFSWTVVGAVAQATNRIEIFSEVVCPIMRYHPAIVAQAAATCQILSDGRYVLGVGTGENLNEHIIGEGWPHITIRQEMLREAIEIIRALWEGELCSHYGTFFSLEAAQLYSVPSTSPPLIVSAFGEDSATLAGNLGDGLVSASPDAEIISQFEDNGGASKRKYAQISVCYDINEQKAHETAFHYWPTAGIEGEAKTELKLPEYFEALVPGLDPRKATQGIVLGPDPTKYLETARKYLDAGFDHLYFHQIGPDQEGFMTFFSTHVLPALHAEPIRS